MKKWNIFFLFLLALFFTGLFFTNSASAAITWETADSYQLIGGSLGAGTIASTTSKDSGYLQINEANGAPPNLQFTIDFHNVTSFTDFFAYESYTGSASHYTSAEIYNFTTAAYVNLYTFNGATADYQPIYSPIIDSANYISATGTVRVQFRHIQNGTNTHYLRLDYIGLRSISDTTGGGSSTSTPADSVNAGLLQDIYYRATTTAVSASESVTAGTYYIPYILFKYLYSIIIMTIAAIVIYLFFRNLKN